MELVYIYVIKWLKYEMKIFIILFNLDLIMMSMLAYILKNGTIFI